MSEVKTAAKTPLEVLTCARELISSPARWTQGGYARNAAGMTVQPHDEGACSFCSLGAIAHCVEPVFGAAAPELVAFDILVDAAKELYNSYPVVVNDRMGYEPTLKMFDRAIEKAKKDEQCNDPSV